MMTATISRPADAGLDRAEALDLVRRHLGDSARAEHSRFVGAVMARLARLCDGDAGLWEIVGLCHDLDFDETTHDRSRHGVVAAAWLAGSLPSEALQAIAAHDHRTGVSDDTLLADMLKLADATAVIDSRYGRDVFHDDGGQDPYPALRRQLAPRRYLADIVKRMAEKHAIAWRDIVAIVDALPAQGRLD